MNLYQSLALWLLVVLVLSLRTSSILLKNMTSKVFLLVLSIISQHAPTFSDIEKDKCKQYCELHYKYALELNRPQNLNIEKAIELDRLAEEFDDNDACTVHRDNDDREHKRRTAGFMAIVSKL